MCWIAPRIMLLLLSVSRLNVNRRNPQSGETAESLKTSLTSLGRVDPSHIFILSLFILGLIRISVMMTLSKHLQSTYILLCPDTCKLKCYTFTPLEP